MLFYFCSRSIQKYPIFNSLKNKLRSRELTYDNFRKIKLKEIFMPGMIRYRDNYAYILDYQPFPRVLKIDLQKGDILNQYGKQRGAGPGDLAHPTDFDITKNGHIWLADYENSRLSVFSPDGEPEMIIVHKEIPYKISGIESSETITVAGFLSSKLFLIDRDENIIWESRELTKENHSTWNNILAAFPVYLGDKQALQVGNYAGFIAKYGEDGNLLYVREQIAHHQNPMGNPVSGLERLVYNVNRQELDYAVINGSQVGEQLVLHVQHYGEDSYQTLDLYSISDGTYQYSYKLEESFRDMFIAENGLMTGLKADGTLYLYQTKGL